MKKVIDHMIRIQLVLLLLAIVSGKTHAQADAKKDGLELMRRLVEAYRPQGGLSFDIAYRYSLENAPAITIDSLYGSCKMMGDRYWYQLDSTESIKTADCLIMIFKEDDIIYVAKPSANATASNPLAMIDSLIFQRSDITCSIKEEKDWRSLVLNFPDGAACKRIEYRVDKQSGYLLKMISVVHGEQLMTGQQGYAVVEAQFTNYRQGGFDGNLFDSNRYFRKNGDAYVTVAPFEQYKIFLGSPGM